MRDGFAREVKERLSRSAKDEVHGALDITLVEILAGGLCQQGVLVTQEPAVPKDPAVAPDGESQRLPPGGGRVLEGEVLGSEVVCLNEDGGGAEGDQRTAVGARHTGMDSGANPGGPRVVAFEGQESLFRWDRDTFLVEIGRA